MVGKPRDFLYSGSDESSEVGGSWRRWSAPGIERNGDGLKRRAAVTAADGDGSDACVQVRELRLSVILVTLRLCAVGSPAGCGSCACAAGRLSDLFRAGGYFGTCSTTCGCR